MIVAYVLLNLQTKPSGGVLVQQTVLQEKNNILVGIFDRAFLRENGHVAVSQPIRLKFCMVTGDNPTEVFIPKIQECTPETSLRVSSGYLNNFSGATTQINLLTTQ